jgi:hypothetical protein
MKSLGWPLSKKAGLAWSMRWRRDIGKLHDWQVSMGYHRLRRPCLLYVVYTARMGNYPVNFSKKNQ